jgi:hypothetical protein
MISFKSFLLEQPTHPESKPTRKRSHDISKHVKSLKPVGSITTEMDKSQEPPGRDDPYDYNKGKWHKGKVLSKDKTTSLATDIMKKVLNGPKKKSIKEDGMGAGSAGPTNVTGPQSGTDPISATAVHPKKKKKYLMGIRRNPPKM